MGEAKVREWWIEPSSICVADSLKELKKELEWPGVTEVIHVVEARALHLAEAEIERLRSALERVMDVSGSSSLHYKIAKETLETNKNKEPSGSDDKE